MSAREAAIVLLARLLDRLPEPGTLHLRDDVAEVVDALLEAAREPAPRVLSDEEARAAAAEALDRAAARVRSLSDEEVARRR